MEYSQVGEWWKKNSKRRSTQSFFSFPSKILDRNRRSLSPLFPQKNRFACPFHTREIRENTHRHKIVISVSQAVSLFCIRILLPLFSFLHQYFSFIPPLQFPYFLISIFEALFSWNVLSMYYFRNEKVFSCFDQN